jgi:hypothetical protein
MKSEIGQIRIALGLRSQSCIDADRVRGEKNRRIESVRLTRFRRGKDYAVVSVYLHACVIDVSAHINDVPVASRIEGQVGRIRTQPDHLVRTGYRLHKRG